MPNPAPTPAHVQAHAPTRNGPVQPPSAPMGLLMPSYKLYALISPDHVARMRGEPGGRDAGQRAQKPGLSST